MPTPSHSMSTEERANMNGKAWTANPFLVGLLVLALGVPCASADPCTPKPLPASSGDHKMSPEAKLLPGPPDAGFFKPDPCYPQTYDSAAELDIYSGDGEHPRQMIDRPQPPV